jgi:hypoxanthine phosphoribosyltransferase
MISHDQIHSRVVEMANMLHKDYLGQRIMLVCILKGAAVFCVQLLEALKDHGVDLEYLRAKSYDGLQSTGQVQWTGWDQVTQACTGRHVVIVEDIVDTGTTLADLMPRLKKYEPKSLRICTLLDKRLDNPKKIAVDYVGFSIPNHFIVGYGIDYNELYRELPDICVVSSKGVGFDRNTLY